MKGYRDLTPRGGAVYDLFGNGKTAVRMNFGQYLQGVFSGEAYTIKNPATTLVSSINRAVDRPERRPDRPVRLPEPASPTSSAGRGRT